MQRNRVRARGVLVFGEVVRDPEETMGVPQADLETTLDPQREYEGIVTRISGQGLGYLREKTSREWFGFRLSKIQNYAGESPKQLGLHEGARVYFRPAADGSVEYVRLFDESRLRKHAQQARV
jgi:hypothetical protein